MAYFILSRGPSPLDRAVVSSSFRRGSQTFVLLHTCGFEAAVSTHCPEGMTPIILFTPLGHFVGYGDRVPRANGKMPCGDDPDTVLRWCDENFLRFGGAYSVSENLILFTDALASCPLFYAFDKFGAPVVASEAKALLPHLSEPAVLRDFGGGRPLPLSGQTIFQSVYCVPAGCTVVLTHKHGYWSTTVAPRTFKSSAVPCANGLDGAIDTVRTTLARTVQRMTPEQPGVAVTLSGGVDSSAVAALARPLVERMFSFSVGTPFGDEFEKARQVAAMLKTEHHELNLTASKLETLLPELVWCLETYDPVTLQIQAPLAFLHQSIRGYVSTLLTGYGADLVFAGVVDRSLSESQLESSLNDGINTATRSNELSPSFATRCSVTVRNPFWSPEMVRVGMAIPAKFKVAHDIEKFVLRSAVQSLLAPLVAWRPKLGIHDGACMRSLFAQALGTEDEQRQIDLLRRLAKQTFQHQQPAVRRGPKVNDARALNLAA